MLRSVTTTSTGLDWSRPSASTPFCAARSLKSFSPRSPAMWKRRVAGSSSTRSTALVVGWEGAGSDTLGM